MRTEHMSAEQDIRDAESKLYRAMIANDVAALDDICSSELAYVHSIALVENKTEWLAGVKRGFYDYREIKSRDVTIKASGDLAVMYGLADFHMSTDKRPLETLVL